MVLLIIILATACHSGLPNATEAIYQDGDLEEVMTPVASLPGAEKETIHHEEVVAYQQTIRALESELEKLEKTVNDMNNRYVEGSLLDVKLQSMTIKGDEDSAQIAIIPFDASMTEYLFVTYDEDFNTLALTFETGIVDAILADPSVLWEFEESALVKSFYYAPSFGDHTHVYRVEFSKPIHYETDYNATTAEYLISIQFHNSTNRHRYVLKSESGSNGEAMRLMEILGYLIEDRDVNENLKVFKNNQGYFLKINAFEDAQQADKYKDYVRELLEANINEDVLGLEVVDMHD